MPPPRASRHATVAGRYHRFQEVLDQMEELGSTVIKQFLESS